MRILIVDTTLKYLTVVLADSGKVIASFRRDMQRQQARSLIPIINNLLKKKNLNLSAIDYLAVNQGPGSFTGLRIGIATIKGMGFA